MTVLEPVISYLMNYQGKQVNLEQIVSGADRPRRPVLRVMDRLSREGNVVEIADTPEPKGYGEGGKPRRNPTWRIIEKPVLAAFIPRPKRITVRDRMWRIIRARRRFTRLELRRLAGATISSCETFTQMLERDGYLRVIGKDSHQQVYMLIKDTGPVRPATREARKSC